MKPTTTFPWWSQACKQPNIRPKFCTTGSRHKLWATTSDEWKQNYQNGFNHSRKARRSSCPTEVSPADVAIPPPAIPPSAHPRAKLTSNKPGEKHNEFTHFPKDPNCEACTRTKVTWAPCKINLDDRADRIKIAEHSGDMMTADHKVVDGQQHSSFHHKYAVGRAGLGDAMDSMCHDVRLRRCTCVHCTGYGASAVYSSSLM